MPNKMSNEELIAKFKLTEVNENSLLDICCPNCGYRYQFRIVITTEAEVTDEGSNANCGDHEWEGFSGIMCRQCKHRGTIDEFTFEGLDDAISAEE